MWRKYLIPLWDAVAADISVRFGHITIVEWVVSLTFFIICTLIRQKFLSLAYTFNMSVEYRSSIRGCGRTRKNTDPIHYRCVMR